MSSLVIYCADIGSVATGKFGWARRDCAKTQDRIVDQDIRKFIERIGSDLDCNHPVALGFECPLFVPVPNDPEHLTCARDGEGKHAWSAQAGAYSLVAGLSQTVWILTQIKSKTMTNPPVHFTWSAF